MKCRECRAELPAGAMFCSMCGSRAADHAMHVVGQDTDPTNAPDPSPQALQPAERLSRRIATAEATDEQELWTGGYSPKAMIIHWIGALLATAVGLVVALMVGTGTAWLALVATASLLWGGLLAVLAYRRLSVNYRLTNHRFFHEQGILNRLTDRIEVIDMDDITYRQNLVDRFTGVGAILIASSDRTTPQLWLYGIDDVGRVADLLDQARRDERQRRGLYIEHV